MKTIRDVYEFLLKMGDMNLFRAGSEVVPAATLAAIIKAHIPAEQFLDCKQCKGEGQVTLVRNGSAVDCLRCMSTGKEPRAHTLDDRYYTSCTYCGFRNKRGMKACSRCEKVLL